MTTTAQTCTVVTDHHGNRCGQTAACQGRMSDGTTWACCAQHATAADYRAAGQAPAGDTPQVGDAVTVHRYGQTYTAHVTRVGARGAVYVAWTYRNGERREMRWDG